MTASNWSGSAIPGANDLAVFGNTGSVTTYVINFNSSPAVTGTYSLGAISVTSNRVTNDWAANNSSTSRLNGVLLLNGQPIGSRSNVIISNASGKNMTFTGVQSGTQLMSILLGSATENIIAIDGAGSIMITSTITSAADRLLTLDGTGSGALTLAAANTYTGTTKLTAGTLRAGDNNAFGNVANALLLNGGTISSNSATGRSFGYGVTIGGDVSFGDGTNAGELNFAGTVGLGGGTRTVTTVVSTTFAGAVTNGNLTKAGAATLSLTQASNSFGTLTVNAGTASIGANTSITGLGGSGGALNLSAGTLTLTPAASGTVSLPFSGSGGFTKAGSTTLWLTANSNSYAGTTTVSGGTLVANGNLGGSVSVTSGATLGGSGTVGSVTVTAGATLSPGNSPGVLTTGNLTWEGGGNYNWQLFDATLAAGTGYDTISSAGTLTINATSGNRFNINLWTLSGTSPDTNGPANGFSTFTSGTYTLGTFASISGFAADAFNIVTSATNGTGGFQNSFAGGTFSLAQSGGTLNLVYTAPEISAWDYTATGGTWNTAGNWNPASVPSGTASLTFSGGGGTSTNDISLAKATGITFADGAGAYTIAGNALTVGASGVTNDSANTQAISANVAIVGPTPLTANTGDLTFSGTVDTAGNALTVTGGRTTALGVVSGTGGFTKTGSGTAALNGPLASPNVTVSAGAVLMNGANLLADSATVTVNGGTLDIQGNSDTITSLVVSSGSVAGSGGTLTASTYTVSGGGVGANLGGGSLTVAGNATLAGSAAATSVNLASGTLTLGSAGRFSAAPVVTGSSGAVLALGGNESLGSLAGAANVSLGSATLTVGSANTSTTHAGGISGGGSLVKVGSGTMTLSGNNTYSGATTIESGAIATTAANAVSSNVTIASGASLELGAAQTFTALSGAGTLAAGNSAMTFNLTGTSTFGGTLSGHSVSTLTKAGAGTMNFTGDTAGYAGTVTVNAGVITGLSFGSGTVSMTGGSAYGEAGGTIGNSFVIGTPGTSVFYSQNFNTIGSGLPTGWTVRTGANATTLGSGTSLTTIAVNWNASTGQFGNYASATGLTSASGTAAQAASTDRALGARQTGSFGDPGAAFTYAFTTTGQTTASLSLDMMLLDVQDRTSLWSIEYGSGTSPSSFTTLGTWETPATWGTTPLSFSGTAVSGMSNLADGVFRVVALTPSTGSGSRDSIAIDNFQIMVASSAPTTADLGINEAGSTTFTGNIAVTGTANLFAASGGTATFSGAISGTAGAIAKTGAGTVILAGNNTFGGGVIVSEGTLQGTTGSLKGNIANDAAVVFDQATSGTYAGVMSGAGSLAKAGGGTVSITSLQDFAGPTTISAGALALSGSGGLASGLITVAEAGLLDVSGLTGGLLLGSSQTLAGTGDIVGLVVVGDGATVSPGMSPGILNGDDFAFGPNGNYNWQIHDLNGGAGTGWDLISGTGALDITAGTDPGQQFNINLWTLANIGPDVSGEIAGFNADFDYEWKIAEFTDGITGFNAAKFNVVTTPANGTFGFANALNGAFSVKLGGANTQLILSYAAVPEPSAYLLAGLGLAVAGWAGRRRRVTTALRSAAARSPATHTILTCP